MSSVLRVRDWNKHYENNRTRELKRMEWVPTPNRMDGDGFTELLDHPNGVAHFGCWNLCLQVASRCNPRGVLVRSDNRPHDAVSLARMTRVPAAMFQEAIPRLLVIGWLESVTREVAGISQESAGEPHEGAMSLRLTDYGMEGNGMEENGNNTCACDHARGTDSVSLSIPKTKQKADLTPQQEIWFTSWWSEYWLRKAKKAAREAFRKHVTSEERFNAVMAATRAQSPDMLSREPSKRPHGATWLNGERWNDEVTQATLSKGDAVGNAISEAMEMLDEEK